MLLGHFFSTFLREAGHVHQGNRVGHICHLLSGLLFPSKQSTLGRQCCQEQHGWSNATWAGLCQTLGDLLAGFIMAFLKNRDRVDLEESPGHEICGTQNLC